MTLSRNKITIAELWKNYDVEKGSCHCDYITYIFLFVRSTIFCVHNLNPKNWETKLSVQTKCTVLERIVQLIVQQIVQQIVQFTAVCK